MKCTLIKIIKELGAKNLCVRSSAGGPQMKQTAL